MSAPSRRTLARKIAGLAVLNLSLLILAAVVYGAWQYGLGPESFLLAPSRERVESIANQIGRDINDRHRDPATVLAERATFHHAQFTLVDPDGALLAGPRLSLPQALMDRMQGGPRPRPGEPKGPRRGPPDGDRHPSWREEQAHRLGENRPPPRRDAPSFFAITGFPPVYWAGARMPYEPQAGENIPGILLIRVDSILASDVFADVRTWAAIALGMIGISALCWAPFLVRLRRDIAGMQQATRQIASGRFDVAVPHGRNDEVGQLGTQIGRMAGRLDHFVRDQKRFLGDIAHELSAPMARVQFALGILEQKLGEAEQPAVARLRTELEEMSGLVNELLQFSKADVQSGALNRASVGVAAAVERAAQREGLAAGSLHVDVDPDLSVVANEVYLVRALANVLRNAARYAGDAGPIDVTARAKGKDVTLEIADHGPGLPESEIEQVFEPFYRPEADRSRQSGGSGLGLAIVKSCVAACGGVVECFNRHPTGLVVRIVLQRPDKAPV